MRIALVVQNGCVLLRVPEMDKNSTSKCKVVF
jgi:hypothetical protein